MKDYADWQREVLSHVRYRPDRAKIAQELTAHYIDPMMHRL